MPETKPIPDETCSECGTGLCAESQADGVPCDGPGRQCETCGRARTGSEPTGPEAGDPPRRAGVSFRPAAEPPRGDPAG